MPSQSVGGVDTSSVTPPQFELLNGASVLFVMDLLNAHEDEYALNYEVYTEPGGDLQFIKGDGRIIMGKHTFFGYKAGEKKAIRSAILTAAPNVTGFRIDGGATQSANGMAQPQFVEQYKDGWKLGLVLSPQDPATTGGYGV